ncbi:helix-turn-helix transcriptional regulator [Actinomadura sp. WMMB 499]|uniref:helix-turn-helix domain-containing protein n=1 Tax=Actinomadura sp. WMMB 499 TaxID=1219491 RepID=UPI0012451D99|nr:helix-turn-helix transcriptional regulator [Actinomadura sp. WMMB 499]QFG22865.1 helix-turn-helix domain-containing protein [Actinomadura sp. WMMB 499]
MEEAPERYRRERDQLARALKRLRLDSGLTGTNAARQVGMSQPKISRLENGTTVPTAEDVETLGRLYGAGRDTIAELVDLAESLHRHTESARAILRGGAWRKQQQIGRVEKEAKRLRFFQPATVSGLLQTPEFTREIYSLSVAGDDLERSMAALAERQRIFGDRSKRFTFVLTEGALRWRLCTDEVMGAQVRHIAALARRPNVRIGIIPFTARVREVPLHGFEAFDERLVTVGLETATITITDARDIQYYVRLFAELERTASFGAEAEAIFEQIASSYSSGP